MWKHCMYEIMSDLCKYLVNRYALCLKGSNMPRPPLYPCVVVSLVGQTIVLCDVNCEGQLAVLHWICTHMVIVKFKLCVERCLYIWFEYWTAAFADTFEPEWPPPRLACHQNNSCETLSIYIWFESWTAAFADTIEPDWPPPRLACYSPTYHSSLFYFVSYNHNHNMNAIINIQFIFECTICSFYITLLDGSNMIHPSKHETFTQCWYNVGPGVHIVPKLGECFLGQSQRLAQS